MPAIVKTVLLRIKAHNVVLMAAGIAFYATLAMLPMLIALVSIYAIVTEPADIADQIDSLASNLDPDTADLIEEQLTTALEETEGSGPIGLAIGIVLALFSVSGAVQKLMLSINLAYGATEGRKGWKVRGLAYLFTAGALVTAALVAFLLGALPKVLDEVGPTGPLRDLVEILRFPLLGSAFIGALATLYRYGPDRSPRTPWRNPGMAVATGAFLLFTGLLALFFRFAGGMPPSYGILGSIAAVIIFFQLCAIAVIIGAEVNAALEGSASVPFAAGPITSAATPVGGSTDRVQGPEPMRLGTAVAGLVAILLLSRRRD